MERFGDSVGAVPQPCENGQGDEVLVVEVFSYRLKGNLILLGRLVGYGFRPSDDRFFLFVEEVAVSPVISLKEIDMLIGVAKGSAELFVVPNSVVAGVDVASFQNG